MRWIHIVSTSESISSYRWILRITAHFYVGSWITRIAIYFSNNSWVFRLVICFCRSVSIGRILIHFGRIRKMIISSERRWSWKWLKNIIHGNILDVRRVVYCGNRSVVGWIVLWIFGLAIILYVSHITRVTVHCVSDGLCPAVRQKNVVRAGHYAAVASLLVTEIVAGSVVFDG